MADTELGVPLNDRVSREVVPSDEFDPERDIEINEEELDSFHFRRKTKSETESEARIGAGLWFCCFLCYAFVAIIAASVFFFTPETDSVARSVTDDLDPPIDADIPQTASPTGLDITLFPTSVPTFEDILVPTPSPTFPVDESKSKRSCAIIVNDEALHIEPGIPFKIRYPFDADSEVCADTYVGFPDGRNPNRNPWTAKLGQKDCEEFAYVDGSDVCESVGARRCTANELQFGAGQGSGCNGDNSLLFTSTTCTNNGLTGFFKVNLQMKKDRKPFFECETDLNVKTVVRCCADVF